MIELLFFLFELRMKESTDNYHAVNRYNYMGAYQMGGAALVDTGMIDRRTWERNGGGNRRSRYAWTGKFGVDSMSEFLNDSHAQDLAIIAYHKRLYSQIKNRGYLDLVDRGVTLAGVELTDSGMVAGAHLVGMGNLIRFIESGGRRIPRDGNRVPITEYMTKFGGYELGFDPVAPPPRPAPIAPTTDASAITPVLVNLHYDPVPRGLIENFRAYEVASYIPTPPARPAPFVPELEAPVQQEPDLLVPQEQTPDIDLRLPPVVTGTDEPTFVYSVDDLYVNAPYHIDEPAQFMQARGIEAKPVPALSPLKAVVPWDSQDMIALLIPAHDENGNVIPLGFEHPTVTMAREFDGLLLNSDWGDDLPHTFHRYTG